MALAPGSPGGRVQSASCTSFSPGSDTSGVPASEIKAIALPPASWRNSSGRRAAALCS
jgi:hypothetical protein